MQDAPNAWYRTRYSDTSNRRRRIVQSVLLDDESEVFRYLPFPFEGEVFPRNLGAVVERTVLNGEQPAREVVHADDGSWLVGDGVSDPNEPGAATVAHMSHVIERNSSVASLASLPAGHIATRVNPGDAWSIATIEWPDD